MPNDREPRLERNCAAPCRLPANSVARFLAAIPSIHKGDTNTLLFTPRGVEFFINGRSLGQITNPDFKQVILPPSPSLGHVRRQPSEGEGILGGPG